MLLMIDGRQLVIAGYETGFAAEGVAIAGFAVVLTILYVLARTGKLPLTRRCRQARQTDGQP